MESSPRYISENPYDPTWSDEEKYWPGRARDALGIESFSELILEDLLPGINNQTRRALYYTFCAWVLYRFVHDENASHTQQGFYQWLRGPEAMLIFSHLAHGHGRGVWGTDQGKRKWRQGTPETFQLDWKSHLSRNGGAYEQYYRGPLAAMNIIGFDPEKRRDVLQRPVGTALAEAYDRAVSRTVYAQAEPKPTLVPQAVIEDFAQAGCLCR